MAVAYQSLAQKHFNHGGLYKKCARRRACRNQKWFKKSYETSSLEAFQCVYSLCTKINI